MTEATHVQDNSITSTSLHSEAGGRPTGYCFHPAASPLGGARVRRWGVGKGGGMVEGLGVS